MMVEMADEPLAKGWHPDPSGTDRFRFWDGREWIGFCVKRPNGTSGHYSLRGWQAIWYGRVLKFPPVFYPLAWFNCSVPGTRGRLSRLAHPPQGRWPGP
jgi:hypothetical protein